MTFWGLFVLILDNWFCLVFVGSFFSLIFDVTGFDMSMKPICLNIDDSLNVKWNKSTESFAGAESDLLYMQYFMNFPVRTSGYLQEINAGRPNRTVQFMGMSASTDVFRLNPLNFTAQNVVH